MKMAGDPQEAALDSIHHVALEVPDIGTAVEWYTRQFSCKISYQDATWAMLDFANLKLALVLPAQHPAHIAIVHPEAEKFGPLRPHRDGTRSCYVTDPAGNSIELLGQD
jgi:catechol 2,3-dioxygenase-like lactoylglutathione lyase family enzyme